MSDATATELAPARPRAPSRAIRKRDGRVCRVVRKIKKHVAWLDQPHFATLLYTYGARGATERDYRPTHALGLSPSAERALRHDAALEASHRKWLELAKDAEVVPTPAARASANGRPH